MRNICTIITLSLLAVILAGCSGSGSQGISPPGPAQLSMSAESWQSQAGNRVALGYYKLRLYESGDFELVSVRTPEMHVNVTKLLFPPKCLDCFLAELLSVKGELWEFKFTIRNPTGITGYDCRVTLLALGDLTILDPSSYTKTFALPGDEDPINPFVVFDTGNGQNQWTPGASATTIVNFFRPQGHKFSEITIVIDGSYPGNQEDPYKIAGLNAEPPSIKTDGSNTTNIAATVYDWQSNVNYVTVDLSALGGSGTAEMMNAFNNVWILEDIAYQPGGDGVGTHYLLVTAGSGGQETYNYVPVTVLEETLAFTVEIQQDKTDIDVGETAILTAVPSNGSPAYFFDWDMDYNGVSFQADATGEQVNWHWDNSDFYTIRLRCTDQNDEIAWAETHMTVGGVEPKIIVESPNGGEYLGAGTDFEIKWVSINVDGTVFLQYSKDNFLNDYHIIATNEPSDGSYLWQDIPADYTSMARVRITATDAPAVTDKSDNPFTIGLAGGCDPAPVIATESLPDASQGVAYSVQLECSGGEGALTWKVLAVGDQLPDGLVLESDGLLHGTAEGGTGGTYQLRIEVSDSCLPHAQTDSKTLTLNVIPLTTDSGWAVVPQVLGYAHSTCSDSNGNCYLAGHYYLPFYNTNAFLCKYTPSGELDSQMTWGNADWNTSVRDMITDSSDNIYVTGSFTGTVDFDPGPGDASVSSANGSTDLFISKLDSSLNFLWVKTIGGIGADEGMALDIDESGNIVLGGVFRGTVDVDPGLAEELYTAVGGGDVLVTKLDCNGEHIWARTWGGSDRDEINDLEVDPSGNIWVAGEFIGTDVDFDPTSGHNPLTSHGQFDAYINGLTSNGDYLWGYSLGADLDDYGYGVAAGSDGSVYWCGAFRKTVDFDPGSGVDERTAADVWYGDAFLVQFNVSGAYQWAGIWGSTSYDDARDVDVNTENEVFVSGMFNGTVDVDPGTGNHQVMSNGLGDGYVSKFNALHEWQWVRAFGSVNGDSADDIFITGDGRILTCGTIYSKVQFAPTYDPCFNDAKYIYPYKSYSPFLLKYLPWGCWN